MSVMQIPVVKAKGQFVEIDTDKLPEAVYAYALQIGLKSLMNRGTTGKDAKDLDADGYLALAEKQRDAAYAGKTRIIGAKATKKRDTVEMAEAVRIAKQTVKDMIKANGEKISHYSAAEITKAAKAIVEADADTYLAAARENLAKAASVVGKGGKADIMALMAKDAKKVAAAEAKKESTKKEKAATSAGKVPPTKPTGPRVVPPRH